MGPKLEMAKGWGRQVRAEDWSELGVPTWQYFYEAMKAGKYAEAMKLIEHIRDNEMQYVHWEFSQTPSSLLDYIAQTLGEEEIGKAWRGVATNKVKKKLRAAHHPASIEEAVQIDAQLQRGNLCGKSKLGDLKVVEEEDRFVLTMDPCGTGGKLRRTRDFGVTQKGYPWSWGEKGVLYHCVHCCVYHEILPIEDRGYPVKIHEGVNDPDGPCSHLYYKHPDLIPEHYFTRVGKKKDPSRWANLKK